MNTARISSLPRLKHALGALDQPRADQVDQRQDDDHAGRQPGCQAARLASGKKWLGIVGEGHGVERHDHDVAEHQQRVEAGGEQAVAEGAADEGDRAARAREGQGQPDIGIGGEQGQRRRRPGRTSQAAPCASTAARPMVAKMPPPTIPPMPIESAPTTPRSRSGAVPASGAGTLIGAARRCRAGCAGASGGHWWPADPGHGDRQQAQRDRPLVALDLAQQQLDRLPSR